MMTSVITKRANPVQEMASPLDPKKGSGSRPVKGAQADFTGIKDPDFVALGLGATGMMAMLWTVACGRQAVGVEMRGDPSLGVHWNIREDFYHHLGLIDQMMVERWGEDRIPRYLNGDIIKLREVFRGKGTDPGDHYADEVLTGVENAHISGQIFHTEFIDDRWVDGKPNRVVTIIEPKRPPEEIDFSMIGRPVIDVLNGPSVFQSGAAEVLIMMRRYLEKIEEMDLAAGLQPRVRLFLSHRVAVGSEGDGDGFLRWLRQKDGFITHPDGRKQILLEEILELDCRGKFRRVRKPGTQLIDLGVPELFMIAQGFDSYDADRLGFRQEEVEVDHHDGRGPTVAQSDYLAGFVQLYVGPRLRRRIASEFDSEGNEYWVRQIAVGHEDDPEVGWILVQVPDFETFDPVTAGMVPPGTPKRSKQYRGAHQELMRDFYLEQLSLILEMPKKELEKVQLAYGPKLFSLVEKAGVDAVVAPNGLVAGDSFGNGHFLTSGGAITGMVGHACRMLKYWQDRDQDVPVETALRTLADAVKTDTYGWLQVSAQEFSQAVPINFGDERVQEIQRRTARQATERATTVEAVRRQRHALLPLDTSDWRRPVLRSGRLHIIDLPPLSDVHPAARTAGSGPVAEEHPAPAAPADVSAPAAPGAGAPAAEAGDDQPVQAPEMTLQGAGT